MFTNYNKIFFLLFFVLIGCSSGIRENKLLPPDRPDYANIYIRRLYHVLYYTSQTYIIINEKEVASLYQGEYQKIFLDPGFHKLSVYGGLFSLNPSEFINKKEPIEMNFEKGKNYYFVIQSAWDGPYKIKQVDYSLFNKLVWGVPF